VDFGAHVSGSVDGVCDNVPGCDGPAVVEFKTHNRASFEAMAKDGVKKAKPMHWAQMQAYMLGLGLRWAWYIAVCKDDDRIYDEIIQLNEEAAKDFIRRGHDITLAMTMPAGISQRPSWYECKMCDGHALCFTGETPARSCRTCRHAMPCSDSTWQCQHHGGATIPTDGQRMGCDDYHILKEFER
jgi:hypothetical protein